METSTRTRLRRTSEIDGLYEPREHFDDVEPESEEDIVEAEGEEDNVEVQVSDESDNEETRQVQVSNDENDEPLNKKPKDRDSLLCGTNGYKWSRIPEQCDGQSKTTHVAAPKGPALNVKTPLEAWNLFFDDEILNCILIHTNEEIERARAQMDNNVARKSHYKNVEILEVKAIIGIFYFAGLMKVRDIDIHELWSPLGSSIFQMIMSEPRIKFILSCLRFDDKNTCLKERATDRLAYIRKIWDKFINNCTSNYEPYSRCTIGEQFLSFEGKCKFRMRIPKISVKRYGLKIITMNDAATHYLFNAMPYCGIIKDKIETESESSYYIRRLCEPIYNTERNITCDSWFISIPICDEMLEYNITMVGKVDKNEREIPVAFRRKPANGAEVQFAYNNKKVLVSYTNPKSNKIELLLASYRNIGEIHDATDKPKIVLSYNKTKDGTDSFDKKCCDFSVARRTHRWATRFFYGMLDQANINSFIIYNLLKDNKKMYRREFITDLSMALIKPFLDHRFSIVQLPSVIRMQIQSFLNKHVSKNQGSQLSLDENKMVKREPCKYCPGALDRKTLFKCLECNHPMCKDHTAKICFDCSIELQDNE